MPERRIPRLSRRAVWALVVTGLSFVVLAGAALWSGGSGPDKGAGGAASFLAEQAERSLASGDETAAVGFAERALREDPGNAAAEAVVADVARRRAARPSPGDDDPATDPGQGSGARDESAFDVRVADVTVLLPASFDGFMLGTPVVMGGEASVSGSSAGKSGANRVVWAVHDTGSRDGAKNFIEKTSRTLYGSDAANVTIDGADAHFGTDGTRFATVAYSRGRYVFEVLVSGTDGAPAGYREIAIGAAKAFPDSP